jgi:serine/threonine-protein kinase
MSGTTDRLAAGARIGEYVIEQVLPPARGVAVAVAQHALLPRRARLRWSGASARTARGEAEAEADAMMREARALERLRHPGIPRVYECGVAPSCGAWIATELIEGATLASLIEERGGLGLAAGVVLLAELAEILAHAHGHGVVHGGIHSALIAQRGTGWSIADWAGARLRDDADAGGGRRGAGYPVAAGGRLDARADVFALGMVAYEALTTLRSLAPARQRLAMAPVEVISLLDRMCAADPSARPSSAELRAEARRLVAHLAAVALPVVEDDPQEVLVEDVDVEIGPGLGGELDVEVGGGAGALAVPGPAPLTAGLVALDPSASTEDSVELEWADADAEAVAAAAAAAVRVVAAEAVVAAPRPGSPALRERAAGTDPGALYSSGAGAGPVDALEPGAGPAESDVAARERMRWTPADAYQHMARTPTETMPTREQLEQLASAALSRTATEPMPQAPPPEPVPGEPGASAPRMLPRFALPSRVLRPPRGRD